MARLVDYPRAGRTGLRRFLPSWRQVLLAVVLAVATVTGVFAIALWRTTVPTPSDVARAQTTIVYWADGTTELGRLGEANRVPVDYSDIPEQTRYAVLAAEDRSFYEHGGISPTGIARAMWNNIRGGSTQGASTITQQYAKNAFLTQDRTWSRKLNEALLAVKLETSVDKNSILSNYLNTIYFGRGAYGISTAAEQYFRTDVKSLSLGQSAVLAAVIKAPSLYQDPKGERLDKLEGRWAYVLDGMVASGWLTQAERDAAVFPKLVPYQPRNQWRGTDGYLLAAVRSELSTRGYTDDEINRAGLRVVTTFDRAAQRAAVSAVRDQGPTSGTDGLRVGLAAVRPGTGEVVALYGGPDYTRDSLDNATAAIGQAGSTFKVFALAASLEKGISLSDRFSGRNGTVIDGYRVVNYGDKSYGDSVSLLTATEKSINSAYVDLASQVGYDAVRDAAQRAGIPTQTPGMDADRTFVLGTASPHVIDVASAYSTFAAGGVSSTPTVVESIALANGAELYKREAVTTAAFDKPIAQQVTYALSKVVTDGTGSAAGALGRPAAGKTGTTNGNRSAWFAGYTPQISAAVMLVKDGPDGQPVSLAGTGGLSTVTGGSFPAAIWTAFMSAALADEPVVPLDTGDPATESPSPTVTPSEVNSPSDAPTPTDSGLPTSDPTAPVTPTDPPTAPVTPTEQPSIAPTQSIQPTTPTQPPPIDTGQPAPVNPTAAPVNPTVAAA